MRNYFLYESSEKQDEGKDERNARLMKHEEEEGKSSSTQNHKFTGKRQ